MLVDRLEPRVLRPRKSELISIVLEPMLVDIDERAASGFTALEIMVR